MRFFYKKQVVIALDGHSLVNLLAPNNLCFIPEWEPLIIVLRITDHHGTKADMARRKT